MPTMTPHSRRRPGPLLAGALTMAALSLVAALPGRADDPTPQRLTPAQEAQVFPERKAALLRHQRQRIEALQKGERCISGAGDSTALRNCMREERQSHQDQRQKHREAMREIYERNGITAPMGRQGGGGWGKGPRGN
jgi:uncharacterized protein involved in type VI secretion and phage assembly